MKRSYKKSAGRCALFAVCLTLALAPLGALEISQGRVRLSLHEHTGHFSLYCANAQERFEPLFSDKDPRTSFIEVFADNRIYRLGDSPSFRFRVETVGDTPAIIFESDYLQVRQEFSFIKTAGSPVSNGIQINIRLRNLRPAELTAGLRLLLDTSLGEGSGSTPFFVNEQRVLAETLLDGTVERPWVSRGAALSLMGSVRNTAGTAGKNPDYLHFSNWKRLNEAAWKSPYSSGRNFNYPPYSFGDSAVCYYYEPVPLPQYGETNHVILLTAEDPAGFASPAPAPSIAAPQPAPEAPAPVALSGKEADLALLHGLMNRLDQYLAGQIEITEEELASMELTMSRLRARYNLP